MLMVLKPWVIFLLCSILMAAMGQASLPVSSSARIINGVDANSGEHDYFVTLLSKFEWANGYSYWAFCGGAHIGNGTVVTAAHCVEGNENTPVYILVGNNSADMESEFCLRRNTSNIDYCVRQADVTSAYEATGLVRYVGDESKLFEVTLGDFISHQGYRTVTAGHDIAILQLGNTVRADALALPASNVYHQLATSGSSDNVLVLGHGDTVSDLLSDTFIGSPTLQVASLTAVDDQACGRIFSDFNNEAMVCAKDIGSSLQDSCQGDSGGPLFDPVTNTLLGIVSFGPQQCANPLLPYAVYTDVHHYVEWIQSGGEEPLAYQSYGKNIRLLNETGSMGLLLLMLTPILLTRRSRQRSPHRGSRLKKRAF